MTHYLSGPMSNLPDHNFPTFLFASKRLRDMGLTILSAHEIDHAGATTPTCGDLPWSQLLRDDLTELLKCDALILLPGWPQSQGAWLELTVARALKMPIFYFDVDDLGDCPLIPMNIEALAA